VYSNALQVSGNATGDTVLTKTAMYKYN